MEKAIVAFLCLALVCTLCACSGVSLEKDSSIAGAESTTSAQESTNNAEPETSSSEEPEEQRLLDEFFVTIGTDVSRSDIGNIAKNMGLHIDHKNSGTGKYLYRVAADRDVANVNSPEKGSYVTVSFNALKDDAITQITYFDEERMIVGYWNPGTGYLLTDYNYPQAVYRDENTDTIYRQKPVNNAKEIIEYSFDGEPGENLLETLFASITSETTKNDLLTFVDEHGLSYNSRGAGNEQVVSYYYSIGDKFGESGSYITFSVDDDDLITRVTYWYYPANYRNGYTANFYSESYARDHSTPSGFVLKAFAPKAKDRLTEYSSAEELLAELHN